MNGIPSFRLEKDVIEAEIDVLRAMGVEFKCGVEVGRDITIKKLRRKAIKPFMLPSEHRPDVRPGFREKRRKGY